MKIPALLTALALTCGAAFAAGNDAASQYSTGASTTGSATVSTDVQPRSGLANKTRRAFHRMGDATRHALHRVAHPLKNRPDVDATADRSGVPMHALSATDTTTMGAPASDATASARQSRLDSAYRDYSIKHSK